MRTIAIIQARMGSSRLPGKMLLSLAGQPVVRHVYDRACRIVGVDEVLVATTVARTDEPLASYCAAHGIPIFRGSEDDVLDRYCQAARSRKADVIVRITGDCPLLDPVESARVLQLFNRTNGCDYASNTHPPFLPDGLDTEVVRAEALTRVWREIDDPVAREHVTYYIPRHPEMFHLATVTSTEDLSRHRWTLDNQDDYTFLAAVTDELQRRRQFGWLDEVLAVLRDIPKLAGINEQLQRNEGLQRSLKKQLNLPS